MPPIIIEVTECRQYEACCAACGHHNIAPYSNIINKGQTHYGSNIKALVTLMSVRQYMPMSRLVEFVGILVGHNISQGTVYNILKVSAQKTQAAYVHIRNQIAKSEVIRSDESG